MSNTSIRILFFLSTICSAFCLAYAKRPLIDSLDYKTNENIVTVKGRGFGSRGATVHLFDTFEKGVDGNDIKTGPGSATVGGWDRTEGNVTYSSKTSVSGNLAMRADMSSGYRNLLESTFHGDGERMLFISYWVYLADTDHFPGKTSPHGINWKLLWIMGENTTDDDLVVPVKVGKEILIDGNDDCLSAVSVHRSPKTPQKQWTFKKGRWHRLWAYVFASHLKEGELTLHELTTDGVSTIDKRKGVQIFCTPLSMFERLYVNGYGRQTQNSRPLYDDVYIATGKNARARIVLGNAPDYRKCTDLAITVIQKWSDSSITTEIYRLPQKTGHGLYLFVVDSKGRISDGVPLKR
ncbi:MAG: hypothetical protein ACOC4C_03115 [Fibrobacterota bacterium]